MTNPDLKQAGLISLTTGLITTILSVIWGIFVSSRKVESKIADQNREAQKVNGQIEAHNQKIIKLKEDQSKILREYEVESITEFFTEKARIVTTETELSRQSERIKGILNGEKIEAITAKQTKLMEEKAQIEKTELTPEVKAAQLSPNEYLKKRRELDMLLIEQKRVERKTGENKARIEDNQVNPDEITNLEEMLTSTEESLKKSEGRAFILERTIQLIESALTKTSQSTTEEINEDVEKYLPQLTQNRYKEIRLNEKYDLEVFSEEAQNWIKPLGQLSLGTVDQIYLITRINYAKKLSGGKLNYLFLDDPFVTFDSERLESMKNILEELSKDTQTILFTHSSNYDDWGNLVTV